MTDYTERDYCEFELWLHMAGRLDPDYAFQVRRDVRKLVRRGCTTREEAGEIFSSLPPQRKCNLRSAFGMFLEWQGVAA